MTLYHRIVTGYIFILILKTLWILTIGFAFSCSITFLAVFLMYYSEIAKDLVDMFVTVVHPIPGIAWIPFAFLWFGLDVKAAIFVIFLSAFFPMVLNVWTGFTYVNKRYIEIGKILRLNRITLFARILLPSSLPYVLTGLRIGIARAWRTLIAVEMIMLATGEWSGLGAYIWEARLWLCIEDIIVGMVTISIIGFIIEKLLFSQVEKRTLKRWMPIVER